MYRLLPEVAAVSQPESGSILLIIKEDERSIRSIGVNPAYESEIVLASVIFSEKYETRPQIIPTRSGIRRLEQNADAYLACGDETLKFAGRRNKIDLMDEWQDIMDIPYVHGFWIILLPTVTCWIFHIPDNRLPLIFRLLFSLSVRYAINPVITFTILRMVIIHLIR